MAAAVMTEINPIQGQPTEENVRWSELLESVLNTPGTMSTAYRAFHNYSVGNQVLVWYQLLDREMELGPVATFAAWIRKGRSVKKGEKALVMCSPCTCKKTDKKTGEESVFVRFTYKKQWFTVHQTQPIEGAEQVEIKEDLPEAWDKARALTALDIREVPFAMIDGNCQGYASQNRTVAINPVAAAPMKTLVHELAHMVLGHLDERVSGSEGITPKDIKELEAETVAILVCDSLGTEGFDLSASRAYVQHWFRDKKVPEKSASRIFSAANKILNAGYPVKEKTKKEEE